MNIAFPALLLFLFLLPGFVFRAAFRSLEGSRVDAGPFASSSIKSVVYALFLNVIGWTIVEQCTRYTVHWNALLAMFHGDKVKDAEFAIALVAKHPWAHVGYFLALYAGSAAAGWFLRGLVTVFALDRADRPLHRIFRSGTEWYYLFNGYDLPERPDVVYVTAVVNLDEPYLYIGIFQNYFLTGEGDLDRVVLSEVARRKLSADNNDPTLKNPAFYPIEGEQFILRYSEMVTLNVSYWWLDVQGGNVTDDESDEPPEQSGGHSSVLDSTAVPSTASTIDAKASATVSSSSTRPNGD